MDNRETLTPSSGDAILKRHLFSEVARNWIKGRGHIGRAYFVRRPGRQSFGFRVAASSGPIPKAPGSAGGYLPSILPHRTTGNVGIVYALEMGRTGADDEICLLCISRFFRRRD